MLSSLFKKIQRTLAASVVFGGVATTDVRAIEPDAPSLPQTDLSTSELLPSATSYGAVLDAELESWLRQGPHEIWREVDIWAAKPYATELALHTLEKDPVYAVWNYERVDKLTGGQGAKWLEKGAINNPFELKRRMKRRIGLNQIYDALPGQAALAEQAFTPENFQKAAERHPLDALYFLENDDSLPFAPLVRDAASKRDALIRAAEEQPEFLFFLYSKIKDLTFVDELLQTAAKSPVALFQYLSDPKAEKVPNQSLLLETASNREALLAAVDKSPLLIAYSYPYYKDKPFAQEIRAAALDEKRVRAYVKKRKIDEYIRYLEAIKDQPYAKEIFIGAVKENYLKLQDFLKVIGVEPYAAEVVLEAYKKDDLMVEDMFSDGETIAAYPALSSKVLSVISDKNARLVLSRIADVAALPDGEQILLKVARNDPKDTFFALVGIHYLDLSGKWGEVIKQLPVAKTVLQEASRQDPKQAFLYFKNYANQPWAMEVLDEAIKASPFYALYQESQIRKYLKMFDERSVRESGFFVLDGREHILALALAQNLVAAASKSPFEALQISEFYKNRPDAKLITTAALQPDALKKAASQNPFSLVEALPFFKQLAEAPEIISVALASNSRIASSLLLAFPQYHEKPWAKRLLKEVLAQDPAAYYLGRKEIQEQVPEYMGELDVAAQNAMTTAFAKQDKNFSLRVVNVINTLHDEADQRVRFAIVDPPVFNAERLFGLIVDGRAEVFTSSYNGLLDRFFEKLKAENKSFMDVLGSEARFAQLPVFLEAAASYGRLDDVLMRMPQAQHEQLAKKLVAEVARSEDLGMAISLSETMSHLHEPVSVGIFEKALAEAYVNAPTQTQRDKFGLIGARYVLLRQGTESGVLKQIAADARYVLPDLSSIPVSALFDAQGRNIQVMTFYNDADGTNSFESALKRYKASSQDWRVEEQESYVHISSRRGKEMHIFANKPAFDGSESKNKDGIADIKKALEQMQASPQIQVHRGHSYHVSKTLSVLDAKAAFVFLGSCGGYQNVTKVLAMAPNAHILATQGTGTMNVNDPLLFHINDAYLRQGKPIVWDQVWKYVASLGDERKGEYINPARNTAALFVSRFNALREGQKGKPSYFVPVVPDLAAP